MGFIPPNFLPNTFESFQQYLFIVMSLVAGISRGQGVAKIGHMEAAGEVVNVIMLFNVFINIRINAVLETSVFEIGEYFFLELLLDLW